jgi:exodeoxyribonuclease VII large subunit
LQEYTVSVLSALIKRSIEQNFSEIQLNAEVSALKVHSSGHLYFSLKDTDSVIDAVCWKYVAQRQKIKLEDGLKVKCIGQVTTYPMRSKYQFIVEQFELAGIGELLKLLEERKKKLAEQGFFDISKKKSIPFIPKLIGIITSPTGAVIKDMLHRIKERFPSPILLWPVLVQGLDASRQIVEAIEGMNNLPAKQKPDVLIVARGGGSFEDLMPFNEESIVIAVAKSEIPIISAIGHETDTTLIDYAADLRAPTPTAAAEFVVPERIKLLSDIDKIFSNLKTNIFGNIERKKLFLASAKILKIHGIIAEKTQKADYIFEKFIFEMNKIVSSRNLLLAKITIQKPVIKDDISNIFSKLSFMFFSKIESCKNRFTVLASAIECNSYINILQKGFAFVETEKNLPITSRKEAEQHQTFSIVFSDGKLKVKQAPSQIELL